MSNTSQIQSFLAGKSFSIPKFQRDYAWTKKEVKELFDDVQEALQTNTSHYLGTVVLAQNGAVYEIVDGQQRVSTLVLIVNALLCELDESDPMRIADDIYLLKQGQGLKLNFGANQDFVVNMLANKSPVPMTRGQRNLMTADAYCRERAKAISGGKKERVYEWLNTIKGLEIISFIETSPGRAIRIFQSVNDRGRKLNDVDKAKALLILYSSKFLDGALDGRISEAFGECFAAYDRIREYVGESGYQISLIDRVSFSEDDLLRYHYLAYNDSKADDYLGYSDTILNVFLKDALKLRQENKNTLRDFILDYVDDLRDFAVAFADLIRTTRLSPQIFNLLIVHGLAARLFPLTIRMHQRKLLNELVSNNPHADILSCIETVNLRVYKIRGTDPARDIGALTHKSRNATAPEIGADLRNFVVRFMPDNLMQIHLGGRLYRSGSVVPILLGFEQECLGTSYDVPKLVKLVQESPTQEHILSQTPSFSVTGRGFVDQTDFDESVDKVGNLTLLTAAENTRCGNKSVELKMSIPELYLSSHFAGPRTLAQEYSVSSTSFNKVATVQRSSIISLFAISKWSIW